jgi:hypothetical protein
MTEAANRYRAVISVFGETFTVSGVDRRGIFSVLAAQDAESFLTATEWSSADRPVWRIQVPYDDPTSVSQVLIRAGSSLTVLRTLDHRLAGTVLCRTLIAAG